MQLYAILFVKSDFIFCQYCKLRAQCFAKIPKRKYAFIILAKLEKTSALIKKLSIKREQRKTKHGKQQQLISKNSFIKFYLQIFRLILQNEK